MRPAPRAHFVPPLGLGGWWPVTEVATTEGRWYADHLTCGWWDPGDLPRTWLRLGKALVDELLATLPQDAIGPDTHVVELGCGPGVSVQELLLRTGARVSAYDADPVAANSVALVAPEATWCGTLPLDLPDGSADVVWVPTGLARGDADWAALLAEAHRLLHPGGHLVALQAGPGVWTWEHSEPWDEETTGVLASRSDRPAEEGGPFSFTSSWWVREHWGRGFELASYRRAGVLMEHTDSGYGMSSWRRADGPPVSADDFSAVDAADPREAVVWQRQLELWAAEQEAESRARTAALDAARARLRLLQEPDAAARHPAVRAAQAKVDRLRAQVDEIRESAWWRAGDAVHRVRGRIGSARATDRGGVQ